MFPLEGPCIQPREKARADPVPLLPGRPAISHESKQTLPPSLLRLVLQTTRAAPAKEKPTSGTNLSHQTAQESQRCFSGTEKPLLKNCSLGGVVAGGCAVEKEFTMIFFFYLP